VKRALFRMLITMGSTLRRAVPIALAAVLLSASVAVAGNGATVTHFAVSYLAEFGEGPLVDCTGNRIVQSDPNAFVKDTETCTTVSDLFPVGSYKIVAFTGDNWSDFLWASDYEVSFWVGDFTTPPCYEPLSTAFGQCFRTAESGNLKVEYSEKSGLYTWSIVAYYAPY
jgi:hypothetical protein